MHNNTSYNSPHFFFTLQNQASTIFDVTQITGKHDALCQDYCFNISVMTEQTINVEQLLGASAQLYWSENENTQRRHGIISSALQLGKIKDHYFYELTLHSPLYPLQLQITHRIFQQKTIVQIVTEILEAAHWPVITFRFMLQQQYPVIQYITQFNQSDYDFIDALLIQYGLVTVFEQNENQATLIITDCIHNLYSSNPLSVNITTPSQLLMTEPAIYSWQEQCELMTDHVTLNAYDYFSPETNLIVTNNHQTKIPGIGTLSLTDQHYTNMGLGTRYAEVMQSQLDCQRVIYLAQSDHKFLMPGYCIQLKNNSNDIENTIYQIISISHHVGQFDRANNVDLSYRNQLVLIPITEKYQKSNYWCDQKQKAQQPAATFFLGIMASQITQPQSALYGATDEYGLYNVQLPFVHELPTPAPTSLPIRIMQAYGGNAVNSNHYGWHFPLAIDNCVGITFINNDLNRPIILGTLNVPATTNPVTAENNTQNILQTWGGQQLLFEEKTGQSKIQFNTARQENIVTINNSVDMQQINLQATQGQVQLYAKQNITLNSENSIAVECAQNYQLTVTNNHQLFTQENDIQFTAGNNINLKAQQDLILETLSGDALFDSKHQMTLQTINSCNLKVMAGNVEMQILQGDFCCFANKINVECVGIGEINLKNGMSSLCMDYIGNINFSAGKITVSAPIINFGGSCNFGSVSYC